MKEAKTILQGWCSAKPLEDGILAAYSHFKPPFREKLSQTFESNKEIAKGVAVKACDALNKEKYIKCKKVYLRANSLISFEAIFVINESAFLSDYFNAAYKITFAIAQPYQNNDFDFDFIFMPSTRHVDKTALEADGYVLSYTL